MTVASNQSRKTFAGNGVTTSFATTPIVFFDSADLTVTVTDDATGDVTTLVENTDYSVTGGGTAPAVGTVSLAGGSSPYGAPATGTTVVIFRDVALTQESDFVNNDGSDSEVAEAALDRLTMIAQRLDDRLDRAVHLPDGDATGESMELPALEDRASSVLGFDAAGGLTTYDSSSSVTTSDNVTFVPSGTGATSRTVQAKLRDVINAKDFGVTADGATDDYAALILARDATPEGATLVLPAGTIKVSAKVSWTRAIVVQGQGCGRGINPSASGDSPGTEIQTTSTTTDVMGIVPTTTDRITGVHLRDFSIKGNKASGTTGHGLTMNAAAGIIESCSARNVVVWNCKQNGVSLSGTCFANSFDQVFVDSCGTDAWDLSGTDVNQNRFTRCTGLGSVNGFDSGGGSNSLADCAFAYNTAIGLNVTSGNVQLSGQTNLEDNPIGFKSATGGSMAAGMNIVQSATGPANPVGVNFASGATMNVWGAVFAFNTIGTGKHLKVDAGAVGPLIALYTSPAPASLTNTTQGVEQFLSAGGRLDADGTRVVNGSIFPVSDGTKDIGQDTQDFRFVRGYNLVGKTALLITDGVTAPGTTAGFATIYVDTSDGDLKVKFGDGTVKTIVVDT